MPTRRYKMNDVDITLEQGAFLVKNNIYEFSHGFFNFLTKSNVTYDDNIEEDENKIKRFLKDIRYDVEKGDKKSARYKTIKRIMGVKDDVFGRGLNSNPNPNNQGTSLADQRSCHLNGLVERLELFILETKAGNDGLYDEMLDLSKQLLSLNIINQEQLDNFVFNYGKKTEWTKLSGNMLRRSRKLFHRWAKLRLRPTGNPLGEPRAEPLRRWLYPQVNKAQLKLNNNY